MKVFVVFILVLVALSAPIDAAAATPPLIDVLLKNHKNKDGGLVEFKNAAATPPLLNVLLKNHKKKDGGLVEFNKEPTHLGIRDVNLFCSFSSPDAACAAYCIWLGNSGGRCEDGACVCRK